MALVAPPEVAKLFGISLHRIRMGEAIDLLLNWMVEGLPCRYVVTPNVDHIVKLQSFPAMQAAYRDASLVVADGWPLVAASRWLRQPLPERIAGSDLVPGLFTAGNTIPGFRVFLLGGAPGVADQAAERIARRWPDVQVVGTASPRQGFESDPEETENLIQAINAAAPHLLIVGLGAPKQEIWLQRHALQIHCAGGDCGWCDDRFFGWRSKARPAVGPANTTRMAVSVGNGSSATGRKICMGRRGISAPCLRGMAATTAPRQIGNRAAIRHSSSPDFSPQRHRGHGEEIMVKEFGLPRLQ